VEAQLAKIADGHLRVERGDFRDQEAKYEDGDLQAAIHSIGAQFAIFNLHFAIPFLFSRITLSPVNLHFAIPLCLLSGYSRCPSLEC
jgi:hypothetical protein